jgi:flagellar basal-body rod modification protein FlgD
VIDALSGTDTLVQTQPVVLDPKNPGGDMGKDEFLQLLVAQLKNQDPMNPLNAEEFAAQLAQFSTLEQLMNLNDTMEGQISQTAGLLAATNAASALEVVGRDILAVGSTLDVGEGGPLPIVVGVGGTGGSGTLEIFDEEGEKVGSQAVSFDESGRQEIELSGALQGLSPGRYSYELEVVDEAGSAVEIQTFSRLHIDGVRYGPGGPVLMSGNLEIPLSDVAEVLAVLG